MCVSSVIVKLVVLLELVHYSWTVSVGPEYFSLDSAYSVLGNREEGEVRSLDDLPDAFAEEQVKKMVQMLLAQDLQLEQQHKLRKRQYKRDIYSTSASTIGPTTGRTVPTRRVQPVTSHKTTKQQKPSKSSSNSHKNKARPSTTHAIISSKATKATTKPYGDTKAKVSTP